MADIPYAVLSIFPAIAAALYFLLHRWRYQNFANIPSPLAKGLFLGHLGHIVAGLKKLPDASAHPDYAFEKIFAENGSPDYMFFDTRPAQYPMILIASHELAEQISKSTKLQPLSTAKSPTVIQGLGALIGKFSLLGVDGELWKHFRKQFNPGFAPQHLHSLLPIIFRKTQIFTEKLDALAKSGEMTALEPLCTNVTFDIITEAITNVDCKAQTADAAEEHAMVKNFRILSNSYASENNYFLWLNFPLQIKRYIYGRRLDVAVNTCVQEKFDAMTAGHKATDDRSVLALALKDIDVLTPRTRQTVSDQIKTFIFAGHDTTSILLQRLFYELSLRPACLAKLRAEHDDVFGASDPMPTILARPEDTMKALVYTSACIKEALRLWPPAATARMSHNGLTLRTAAHGDICVDDCVLYLCHYLIHRDPSVYGATANDFVPERWVGDNDTSSASVDADAAASSSSSPSKIPISAWRAFERGPRNCIGQELANLEVRIILVYTVRRYDFTKVGVGEVDTDAVGRPVLDAKGRYRTKSELLNTMSVTSKPIDGTMMRLRFH